MIKLNTTSLLISWLCFILPYSGLAQEPKEGSFDPDSIDAKYQILYEYESYDEFLEFKEGLKFEKISMTLTSWDAGVRTGDEPSYSISIFKNGDVEFIGKENLKLMGKYRSSISDKMYVRLCYYIEKINFETLPKFNGSIASHADPYDFVIEYSDGTKKEITDAGPGEPIFLWSLERIIDNFRFNLNWEKRN